MVTDFSGTSILSHVFVVIGRAITANLGVLLGLRAKCGKKWLKKPKSERNDKELVSFRYWTRLDELIILVWSNVKKRIKNVMATQRWAKSGRAANSNCVPISGNFSHIF